MKRTILLIGFILISTCVNAQNKYLTLENDVKPHKEVDAIYGQFSEAYRTLDLEKVVNLYAADAKYLPPNNDILNGHNEIRSDFKSFFDWVKKEQETMTISFHIFQRKVSKDIGYDVGIFTLQRFKDGKKVGEGKGKFIVVAVKIGKKWKFQVDGYSNLKPEEKK